MLPYLFAGLIFLVIIWAIDYLRHSSLLITRLIQTILAITWLLSPLYYEFSGWPVSVPISFGKDGVVKEHPFGMFTIGLQGKYANLNSVDDITLHVPSVTMLTENPKIRTLTHHISVSMTNRDQFFGVNSRMMTSNPDPNQGGTNTIAGKVRELWRGDLYRFNNTYSKELAALYNPLDPAQQDTYRKLIEPFLNPILASNGISIVKASFDIH